MRRYQGVVAFCGFPGSGKTYSLAEIGVRDVKRGRKVFCNKGFDLAGAEVFETFDDFSQIVGAPDDPVTVVFDEMPLYFNARKFQEFPDSMMYKFTQIRKDGIRFYYSTIAEAMTDVNIRRITFWSWHCTAFVGGVHYRKMYAGPELRKAADKPRRREFFRIKPAVASAYDTLGKVAVPTKLAERVAAGSGESGTWTPLKRSAAEAARGRSREVPKDEGEAPVKRVTLPDRWAG